MRTDVCYTMRRLWVANVGRRLGLGRHGTQRAATCHFPLGRLRPLQEHRTAGNLRSTPSPSSHPGRLRRLPKELARRTRPRRSPSTPPSPPSPRAEGPSPRSRRLSRRRRRVRSRCRATRRSGPGSSSYCAATATTPLRFKPRGCLCTAAMSAEPCWVSRGTGVHEESGESCGVSESFSIKPYTPGYISSRAMRPGALPRNSLRSNTFFVFLHGGLEIIKPYANHL